jgi:hypothetical protein
MIVRETIPLPLAPPHGHAIDGPSRQGRVTLGSVLVRPTPSSISAGRAWCLELELVLPDLDPERILLECEGYLVDGSAGEQIGVVDSVERDSAHGLVSALHVASGWLGRRRVRIEAETIQELVPAERRIVVRQPHG